MQNDRPEAHHVVEMRHHVVGVLVRPVDRRLGEHHAGHAADGEQEEEAQRPEHRRLELDRPAPHRRDPGEDLDARRHRDHHRRHHEVALLGQRHADRVHVVRPDHEAERRDGDHRIDHRQVAEDRLAREGRDHVADDAEARHDDDVDLGVAEEPEDVLVEHRVAAARGVEEGRPEVAVGQQHGDRARPAPAAPAGS